MQSKPVQISIIVIGLLIGIVGIAMAVKGGGGVDLADHLLVVDAATGETYKLKNNRSYTIPIKHPDTQMRTLLPIMQTESGSWEIDGRYLVALERIEEISPVVDRETGALAIPNDIDPESMSL